eukprot:5221217-Prymnesium_polylepis.1
MYGRDRVAHGRGRFGLGGGQECRQPGVPRARAAVRRVRHLNLRVASLSSLIISSSRLVKFLWCRAMRSSTPIATVLAECVDPRVAQAIS